MGRSGRFQPLTVASQPMVAHRLCPVLQQLLSHPNVVTAGQMIYRLPIGPFAGFFNGHLGRPGCYHFPAGQGPPMWSSNHRS